MCYLWRSRQNPYIILNMSESRRFEHLPVQLPFWSMALCYHIELLCSSKCVEILNNSKHCPLSKRRVLVSDNEVIGRSRTGRTVTVTLKEKKEGRDVRRFYVSVNNPDFFWTVYSEIWWVFVPLWSWTPAVHRDLAFLGNCRMTRTGVSRLGVASARASWDK